MHEAALVRHRTHPEWGLGVVVSCVGDGKCHARFEHERGVKVFHLATAGPLLELVDPSTVPADSPLRDPRRWTSIGEPERTKGPQIKCVHCKRVLNTGPFTPDRAWKACPRCSAEDGTEHIYWRYPAGFGESDARVNPRSPEGPQSYCKGCRNMGTSLPPRRRCSEL
jgi:hypothetical protein